MPPLLLAPKGSVGLPHGLAKLWDPLPETLAVVWLFCKRFWLLLLGGELIVLLGGITEAKLAEAPKGSVKMISFLRKSTIS